MKNRCLWLSFVLISHSALAHEGAAIIPPQAIQAPTREARALVEAKRQAEITADYNLMIAPLFQRACADCHSGDTVYPWYATIPGIKQMIEQDIEEARKHIEISNGYPFQSHATSVEDLQAVENVIKEGSMPPLRYRLMHQSARLAEPEKQRIIEWAKRSRELLRAPDPGL